jgi:hypothetical protein
MIQLIAFIIFMVSFSGTLAIVARKVPVLVALPKNGHHGFKKHRALVKIEKRIKEAHFHLFEKQMWLHKLLSKTKVLILRIETKIDTLLHGIRKKAQELDKKKKRK